MKYLSLHPIGDEGANTFVRNPLEFLTIERICKIRIQNWNWWGCWLINRRLNINSRMSGINAFQRCLSFVVYLHIVLLWWWSRCTYLFHFSVGLFLFWNINLFYRFFLHLFINQHVSTLTIRICCSTRLVVSWEVVVIPVPRWGWPSESLWT
jgi:hypothetical protein